MKVLLINVVCGIKSTGRICTDLAESLEAKGHEVKIAYGREEVPEKFQKYAYRIGTDFDVRKHGIKARISDACGFGSLKVTEEFVNWIKDYDPDVINLHNLHGYYVNVEVLFNYLRTCGKRIIWTLHDCWAFTGHAAYCESAGCEKWKNGCVNCPKKSDYPKSISDHSTVNWEKKKNLFTKIPNLQIVVPSEWLAKLVSESYLNAYPVTVINNGIDTDLFKPADGELKDKLRLSGKKIILGVAALWEKRKGLEDFYKLRSMLDEKYTIVLVGLSGKQISNLPEGIIGLERTNSAKELAELYSIADYFLNPTYEDNYPTTNLESISCGTPVITYRTGGSAESAEIYGCAVDKGDVGTVAKLIMDNTVFENREHCFSKRQFMEEYLKIIC